MPQGCVLQHFSDHSSPDRAVPPAWVGVAYALSYVGPQDEPFRHLVRGCGHRVSSSCRHDRGCLLECADVAVCLSVCLPCASLTQPLVIEAAVIRAGGCAGSGELLVTGVGGESMRVFVSNALDWVRSHCQRIAQELGVTSFRAFLEQQAVGREA